MSPVVLFGVEFQIAENATAGIANDLSANVFAKMLFTDHETVLAVAEVA